jgi:hypothetical protein
MSLIAEGYEQQDQNDTLTQNQMQHTVWESVDIIPFELDT